MDQSPRNIQECVKPVHYKHTDRLHLPKSPIPTGMLPLQVSHFWQLAVSPIATNLIILLVITLIIYLTYHVFLLWSLLTLRKQFQMDLRESLCFCWLYSDYQRYPRRDLQKNLRFTNPDLQKLLKNICRIIVECI